MKKFILVLVWICGILTVTAQEKKSWLSHTENQNLRIKSLTEMAALADKSQADHNTYCLIRYHNERMTGFILGLGAFILGGTSLYMKDHRNNYIQYTDPKTHITTTTQLAFMKTNAGWAAAGAGIAGLASFICYIDAEKWISQRRLVFSTDGLAYRF